MGPTIQTDWENATQAPLFVSRLVRKSTCDKLAEFECQGGGGFIKILIIQELSNNSLSKSNLMHCIYERF